MKIDFNAIRKAKTVVVDVAELGASFRLRALAAGEFVAIANTGVTGNESVFHQLASAIIDDDGKTIYTPDELREMSIGAFNQLTLEMNRLNGTDRTAADATLKN